ncbi:hypothetical protein MTO96_023720 [Rhipicephalus appendiculatus]
MTSEHKELWIQKTPITSFPSDVLGDFKFGEVHVELNVNMTSFTMDALMKFRKLLSRLSVYGNALETFEFENDSLKTLELEHNPITFIGQNAFYGLINLKELLLSHTRLTTLEPRSLAIKSSYPMLEIHISSSRISSIHSNAFGLTTPHILNLSRNNITTLERFPFEPLIQRMLSYAGLEQAAISGRQR